MPGLVPKSVDVTERNALSSLVEHRSVRPFDHCELNIFETHTEAHLVALKFEEPVVAAMLRGKKVMHLEGKEAFEFYPGESLILPSEETMVIDFPEAASENPTQCIALEIPEDFIKDTLDSFNEQFPKAEQGDEWHLNMQNYHLENSREITYTLNRLIELSQENHNYRDTFAKFALNELLLRLMQTQARHLLLERATERATDHRLAFAVQYIREHLTEPLSMEVLSDKACMSKPHFFRSFKRELRLTPLEFILKERIKLACKLLRNRAYSVVDVAYKSGFNNFNHFASMFRRYMKKSPAAWRDSAPLH